MRVNKHGHGSIHGAEKTTAAAARSDNRCIDEHRHEYIATDILRWIEIFYINKWEKKIEKTGKTKHQYREKKPPRSAATRTTVHSA